MEVNNTFYRWPKDEVFSTWHDRLPPGFVVSAKASRGLTQFRKLNDPEAWLQRMESGLLRLKEKRGVLLFQLPPHFPKDLDRLDRFLGMVPKRQRIAVEFRHPSWKVEETFAVLERHNAAYCVTSGANLPCVLREGQQQTSSSSASTGRIKATCTPGRTPKTTCAGGPTGSPSGKTGMSMRISTTTVMATR